MYVEQSFHNLIDYWGTKAPDREAIFDGQRRISYGELQADICRVANGLSEQNIQKGDRIMTFIGNRHEFIVLFFAIAKLGAVIVPAHDNLTQRELEDQLIRINPRAVFVSRSSCLANLQSVSYSNIIFTVGFQHPGLVSYADLNKHMEKYKLINAEIQVKQDTFLIITTSGSTGHPKGVELTQHNLFHAAKNLGHRLKCSEQDIFVVPIPIFHMFGIIVGLLLPFYFGARIVYVKKYNPLLVLQMIEKEKATVIYGVPTMYITELEEYRKNPANISSLRTGIAAGANVPRLLREQIRGELEVDIMVAYGSTETVSISCTALDDPIDKKNETVGRPFEGNHVKIVNDEGEMVGPGQTGELLCSGYGLMKGYFGLPVETKRVIDEDGWYHSGDIATIDESGYIKIIGRKDDMIIRGGNNIHLLEIENLYYTNPAVLEVCVLGHPDKILGEASWVFVVLKDNNNETEESLRNYAKERISRYKVPDRIIILDKMPLLSNGKIDKVSLINWE